ncbi:hypothetical protein V2J09_006326 [Rumex salicifolius]
MVGDHRFSRTKMFDHHSVATRSRRITKKGKSVSTAETLTPKRCISHDKSQLSTGPTMSSSHKRVKSSRRKLPRNDDSRRWIYSPRDCSGFSDKVVIVSYNILGVENATRHPDLYYNIPYECLDWNNRKELIFKEIKDLNYGLHKDGFRGVYKARTGDANDGSAIFWKEARFSLLHEEHIEFQKFGLRNNIAQFCILKITIDEDKFGIDVSKPKCLVVGNIHVLFNPNRGDVKLGQIRLFLEKAHKLSEEWGGIPVVLAGDMNSVPQSAIYQFMSTTKLDLLNHHRKKISGQVDGAFHYRHFQYQSEDRLRPCSTSSCFSWNSEELELATGDGQMTLIQNPLKLPSAYHGVPGNSKTRDHLGEPLATSYHSKFMGTVDYIWHTEDLAPVGVLDTLPIDALRRIGGLPSQRWGSDHLALVCELAFIETINQND